MNSRPVIAYGGDMERRYPSATVAARELGCSKTAIHNACRNPKRRCYGWYWRYADAGE